MEPSDVIVLITVGVVIITCLALAFIWMISVEVTAVHP